MNQPTPPPGYKLVKGFDMNKTYTLKELADIGLKAATAYFLDNDKEARTVADIWKKDEFARQSFTKAILDAIGYDFPKNEDREAFEDWLKHNPCWDKRDEDVAFFAWKAGREELRREINKPHYSADEQIKTANKLVSDALKKTAVEVWGKTEPAWIPWEGGECPLADTVKRWEYRMRNGNTNIKTNLDKMPEYWSHEGLPGDIVAYRVLEG